METIPQKPKRLPYRRMLFVSAFICIAILVVPIVFRGSSQAQHWYELSPFGEQPTWNGSHMTQSNGMGGFNHPLPYTSVFFLVPVIIAAMAAWAGSIALRKVLTALVAATLLAFSWLVWFSMLTGFLAAAPQTYPGTSEYLMALGALWLIALIGMIARPVRTHPITTVMQ